MTLEKFKSYLTRGEYEKFYLNYNNETTTFYHDKSITDYLNDLKPDTLLQAMRGAFHWRGTEQIEGYWLKISLRKAPLT